MRSRLRGERGSNAVEFALVLPILVAIVFAVLWGGIALNTRMTITQVAREAARYGATVPFGDDTSVWLDQVESRLRDSADTQLNNDSYSGCVRAYEGTSLLDERPINGGVCGGSFASGGSATFARVEIELSAPAYFDYYWGGGSLTLEGSALARHEGSSS